MPTGKRPHIVIIGAGFGGLSAVESLHKANVDITLIDRTNHHLFQPLLYQVATAGLSPGDIAHPIRSILRKRDNVHVVMDEIVDINTAQKKVTGNDADYSYDYLVVATGAHHSYFGHDEWAAFAPGLKDLGDAILIRDRLLRTFEEAERLVGDPLLKELLTFVVIGGGPTGVELAGAIAEIARKTMLPDFPRLKWSDIKVILVEGGDRVLSTFTEDLSAYTLKALRSMDVDVRLQTIVTDIAAHHVQIGNDSVPTRNVIWAAGNAASSLVARLDAPKDRIGRVITNPDCSVAGLDSVFVIGDAAHFEENGKPLPGVAQVAIQQGRFVGKQIQRELRGINSKHSSSSVSSSVLPPPSSVFVYNDLGSMATIGRARAVADLGWIRMKGLVAWLAWAGLHVLQLISFRNRLRVLIEWMWYYITFQPGARLLLKDQNRRRQ